MDAAGNSTPPPDGIDHAAERRALRASLIASTRTMESTAAALTLRGEHGLAARLRADVKVNEATLDSPEAVDALWLERASTAKAA